MNHLATAKQKDCMDEAIKACVTLYESCTLVQATERMSAMERQAWKVGRHYATISQEL